jgi:hypothetical protein
MRKDVIVRLLGIVVLTTALGFMMGCSGVSSSGNKVKIVNISPDINTPLQVGNSYEIVVSVEYSLKQDNGSITLVLQRGDAVSTASILGNVTEAISKGNGQLTLKANITIPNTNSIQVFTPLSIPGESQTTTVDMRVFKVTGN